MKHYNSNIKLASGFSLVELMVAMLVGMIILAGVMSLYVTTRDTQRANEDQLALLGDLRFAMETIGYDLRHAGIWGETNMTETIECSKKRITEGKCPVIPPAATGDCSAHDYIDLDRPFYASNNVNDFGLTCIPSGYRTGTDVMGVRYTDTNRVLNAALAANFVYIRSNIQGGGVFFGTPIPDLSQYVFAWGDNTRTHNHMMMSRYYFVSDYTYAPGDGLPALRQVALTAGPVMKTEVLLPGVEDFQVEIGLDVDCPADDVIDAYVTADNVTAEQWLNGSIHAARVWVLARSLRKDRDGISAAQTFNYAGKTVTTPNDGYMRSLMSTVVLFRNMTRRSYVRTCT